MVKVHILGGSGSGKSTLAREIALRRHVPHYDLDQLGRKYGPQPRPYIEETMAVAQQPGWVTEGIYLLFVDFLLEHADYIVLLDIAWPTAARRILQRHIINSFRGKNEYPGLKPLFNLLRYARAYYLNQRTDTAEAVRQYFDEHREWTRPTSESVLRKLEHHSTLVIPPSAAFVRRYLAPYQSKVVVVRNTAERNRVL